MQPWTYWIIAAVVAGTLELMTGTLWLLTAVIAAVCAAAIAYLLPANAAAPWTAFALVEAALAVWVIKTRRASKPVPPEAQADDAGGHCQLLRENPAGSGNWRVSYRGSEWDATVLAGEASPGKAAVIEAREGSTLKIRIH